MVSIHNNFESEGYNKMPIGP